jgi:indole-3-glycerol phosphate synthase
MTILNKILSVRKERLADKKRAVPEDSLERTAGPPRPFFNGEGAVTLIAECKKGSPSKGIFLKEYNPVLIATQYERGGADAVSVLTEPDFFYGDEEHLSNVRENVSLPVLRKDFIFDRYQIRESWALGADAILLIAAILSEIQLEELAASAIELGLEILLEVHNREELEKAVTIPATAIGINARNLKDFSIDLNESKELCKLLPKERIAVAESGLNSSQAGLEMFNAGFRGFLVGEYFITAENREETVREFAEALK